MNSPQSYRIIRYPSVTEKNTTLRAANKYVFEVQPDASKTQIKEAIETHFQGNVVSVNTLVVKGKYKRMGKFAGTNRTGKKPLYALKRARDRKIWRGIVFYKVCAPSTSSG